MSGFLARRVALAAGAEAALMPLPRYRFGTRPAIAADAQLLLAQSTGRGAQAADERAAASLWPEAGSPFSQAPLSDPDALAIGTDRLRLRRRSPGPAGGLTEGPVAAPASAALSEGLRQAEGEGHAPDGDARLLPLQAFGNEGGTRGVQIAERGAHDDLGGSEELTLAQATRDPGAFAPRQDAGGPAQWPSRRAMLPNAQAAGRSAGAQDPSTVVVHIGRIDVRAVHAPATPDVPPAQASGLRRPTLHAYLHDRDRGRG